MVQGVLTSILIYSTIIMYWSSVSRVDRRRFFMKDFKLVTEQVDLLKSRGMLFEDEQDAICKLLSDNYYNIINGYKDLFLDTTNNQEVFKTGTTFNEIYALYEFDNQLKNIFLEYILKIENILRTQVAYHFSGSVRNSV